MDFKNNINEAGLQRMAFPSLLRKPNYNIGAINANRNIFQDGCVSQY